MTIPTVAAKNRCILCKRHYKKIRAAVSLPALSETFARLKYASILGGNPSKKDTDRFSYWACEPKEVFESQTGQEEPFIKLQYVLTKYRLAENLTYDLPNGMFCGGWIGYFSYEFGRYIERLPETTIDDIGMPLIRLCFYDRFIAYDHVEDSLWLVALQLTDDIETPEDKLAGLERLLAKSENVPVKEPIPADIENVDFSQIRCNMDKDYYLKAVDKIKRYIYDGDVYQINFSQRFECDYSARPIELFHWQNYYNPSPYAAYIDCGDFHIVSASPQAD
jgi:para-aminobenzoate synthetase component 1